MEHYYSLWRPQDDFNSDDFILEQHCRGISLERLRDDLLQYSNILKSSLIELINQDYADFVSLSTNLVGLDKSINTIAKPLKQLQAYISVSQLFLCAYIYVCNLPPSYFV
ncbi:unnamed protein product [Trichobilharzia regenti]|nr:unnamed protein product [Trichobilharzia regenti]